LLSNTALHANLAETLRLQSEYPAYFEPNSSEALANFELIALKFNYDLAGTYSQHTAY